MVRPRGPNQTATWLGVPRRAISQLNSPIDITLLRRFAQSDRLDPGETLYEYMRLVGEDLLEHLRSARERLDFVARHAEHWKLPLGDETIEVIFLPRVDPLPEEPSGAVASYIRSEGLENSIAALVYPDRRGSGYGIARYEDHPRMDFSAVGSEPDVRFAHKTGFMCKTEATDPDRLKELVQRAWKESPA